MSERWEMLRWALRHPIKGTGLALVATLGYAMGQMVDWTVTNEKARQGDYATTHKIAEGIE